VNPSYKSERSLRIETRAVHSGPGMDPVSGDVAPAIHPSTTFGRTRDSALIDPDNFYTRQSNPNQRQLETAVANLEGGAAARVYASGMAAGTALLQSLGTGDHVLMASDCYFGMRNAAGDFASKWGVEVDLVAMSDLDAVRDKLRPATRLVFAETPSNPMMRITDIAALAEVVHQTPAQLVVDNTFATPILQRPIQCGADVVLHSATKYFGGHSDVLGGCLVFREQGPLLAGAEHALYVLGAALAPFNSWLILRGLKTLACRVGVQTANAGTIATMLSAHPNVTEVLYPGLESHPGHEIAASQMSGFGAVVSFRVRGGKQAALDVVGRAEVFTRATSLGGVESLIEHRATSEAPHATTPDDLIRLSVGIEQVDDLVEDLERALCPV